MAGSLAEMALYVCDQALNVTGNQETSRAARALTSMLHGKMTIKSYYVTNSLHQGSWNGGVSTLIKLDVSIFH